MGKRPFFFASAATVIIALCLHMEARDVTYQGVHLAVARIEAASKQREKNPTVAVETHPSTEESHLYSEGRMLGYVGLAFMLSSIVFLVLSFVRRETAWHLLVIMLLVFDVGLQ